MLKGSGYTDNFWTDGVNLASNLEKAWSWSTQNVYNYGYLKINFINGKSNTRAYLKYNTSQLYELDDNNGAVTGYICEAQGKFKINLKNMKKAFIIINKLFY